MTYYLFSNQFKPLNIFKSEFIDKIIFQNIFNQLIFVYIPNKFNAFLSNEIQFIIFETTVTLYIKINK